jgi:hypothetical protein
LAVLAGKDAIKAAERTERINEKGDKVKCAIRQEESRIKVQGARDQAQGFDSLQV